MKFASGFLNKRALKRAFKEIELEDALIEQLSNGSYVPEREYKTEDEAEDVKKIKVKGGALSKPQTEAVDLKHFKDWRNVDKVESKNPLYVPKTRKSIFDDEDDGDQPSIESPVQTNKKGLSAIIDSMNKSSDTEEKDTKKDTDIASFFAEKYGAQKTKEKNEPVIVSDKKQETPVKSTKTTLNDLIRNQKAKQQETQKSENVVKIEVVDFADKKEEPKVEAVKEEPKKEEPKKVVNRKPRGKNKRRFDADVISSVDWK